jgi:hypothetical protein
MNVFFSRRNQPEICYGLHSLCSLVLINRIISGVILIALTADKRLFVLILSTFRCRYPRRPVLRLSSLLIVDWLTSIVLAIAVCVLPVLFNT